MGNLGNIKASISAFCLLSLLLGFTSASFAAETKYRRVFDARTQQYYYVPEKTTSQKVKEAIKNPVVKQAAVGAAVGTAMGAISDKSSVAKGAAVGALVGTGTGLVSTSRVFEGKPMVRSILKGAAVGTGASALMDKNAVKGAAVGAVGGAGIQLLKDLFSEKNSSDKEQQSR